MITAAIGIVAGLAGLAWIVTVETLRRHRLQRKAAAEREAAERARIEAQFNATRAPWRWEDHYKALTMAEVETFSHIGLVQVAGSLVSTGITSAWGSYKDSERYTLDAGLYLSFLNTSREQLLAIIRKYHESNPPVYCTQNMWRAEQHLRAVAATE